MTTCSTCIVQEYTGPSFLNFAQCCQSAHFHTFYLETTSTFLNSNYYSLIRSSPTFYNSPAPPSSAHSLSSPTFYCSPAPPSSTPFSSPHLHSPFPRPFCTSIELSSVFIPPILPPSVSITRLPPILLFSAFLLAPQHLRPASQNHRLLILFYDLLLLPLSRPPSYTSIHLPLPSIAPLSTTNCCHPPLISYILSKQTRSFFHALDLHRNTTDPQRRVCRRWQADARKLFIFPLLILPVPILPANYMYPSLHYCQYLIMHTHHYDLPSYRGQRFVIAIAAHLSPTSRLRQLAKPPTYCPSPVNNNANCTHLQLPSSSQFQFNSSSTEARPSTETNPVTTNPSLLCFNELCHYHCRFTRRLSSLRRPSTSCSTTPSSSTPSITNNFAASVQSLSASWDQILRTPTKVCITFRSIMTLVSSSLEIFY